MVALIAAPDQARSPLARLAAAIAEHPERFESHADSEVVLHAPVRNPSKILCLALNNSANAERILSGPKSPAAFTKPASALVGHRGAIRCRPEYGRVHPEPELALVIGRRARAVDPAEAMHYVFGYTIHNDITSPTMRAEDTLRLATLHDFASELLGTHRVSAERFERTMHMLGTEVLVELVGLVGYYTLVAMTLNAFEMTLGSDSPNTG